VYGHGGKSPLGREKAIDNRQRTIKTSQSDVTVDAAAAQSMISGIAVTTVFLRSLSIPS